MRFVNLFVPLVQMIRRALPLLAGTLLSLAALGQNSVNINGKKSFLGALEFLPRGELSKGYQRIRSSFTGGIDPMADPKKSFSKNDEGVAGMMEDAVLFFEWWTTDDEPMVRYRFQWKPSGFYNVWYKNENGGDEYKQIYRHDLEKYPNLLKRFDNIQPTNLNFDISFYSGNIPDDEYNSFRQRYNILEDLGSAGYSVVYHKTINGGFIPYFSNNANNNNWTIPSLLLGGWNEFLNFPENLNSKRSQLIELFKMGRTMIFPDFKINSIQWPIDEMVNIAKKLEKYQKGEEQPDPADSVMATKNETASGGGDWDQADMADAQTDPYFDRDAHKYGIKNKQDRPVIEPIYDNILKSPKTKQFIAERGNTVYILNSMGVVQDRKTFSSESYINVCSTSGNFYVNTYERETRIPEYTIYRLQKGEMVSYKNGMFTAPKKWYHIEEELTLTVEDLDDHRTEAQKKEDKRILMEKVNRVLQQTASELESSGYRERGKVTCD